MGLDAGFLTLLTHAIVLNRYDGKDGFGNDKFGPDEPLPAFITEANVNYAPNDTLNQQRQGPDTGAQIIVDAVYIDVGDKITLPSGKVTMVVGAQTLRDEYDDVMQTVDVVTEGQDGFIQIVPGN